MAVENQNPFVWKCNWLDNGAFGYVLWDGTTYNPIVRMTRVDDLSLTFLQVYKLRYKVGGEKRVTYIQADSLAGAMQQVNTLLRLVGVIKGSLIATQEEKYYGL